MARIPNVIAIMSSKGGVGKTVTTANLAVALATKFNKKILAIDTNLSTASLGLHLDLFYPKNTIYDIAKKKFSLHKAIYSYNDNLDIIPACIKVRKKDKNLFKMRENFQKVTKEYEKLLKLLAKNYDLILLDCAPGFDLESIAAMHIAGGMVLITNPEYPSIASAIKTIEYAKKLKMPTGGVILTKAMNKRYEFKKEDIENTLKIKVIDVVPFDKKVSKSIAKKKPIVILYPFAKSSRAYKKIAASLIGKEKTRTFLEKLKKFFKK
jgi:MinD-like ATPase involved in chromosome partitioning or flagellar assembly